MVAVAETIFGQARASDPLPQEGTARGRELDSGRDNVGPRCTRRAALAHIVARTPERLYAGHQVAGDAA